jgi:hypothetical protein
MTIDFFAFSAENARRQFPAKSQPKDGPRECCADRAMVVESDDERSIWACPVCNRHFAVPHPESVK